MTSIPIWKLPPGTASISGLGAHFAYSATSSGPIAKLVPAILSLPLPLAAVFHPLKAYPDFARLPVFPKTMTLAPARYFDG
jgi:hypothetical protein